MITEDTYTYMPLAVCGVRMANIPPACLDCPGNGPGRFVFEGEEWSSERVLGEMARIWGVPWDEDDAMRLDEVLALATWLRNDDTSGLLDFLTDYVENTPNGLLIAGLVGADTYLRYVDSLSTTEKYVHESCAKPPKEFLLRLAVPWLALMDPMDYPKPAFTDDELAAVLEEVTKPIVLVPRPAVHAIGCWGFAHSAELILRQLTNQHNSASFESPGCSTGSLKCVLSGHCTELAALGGAQTDEHLPHLRVLQWLLGEDGNNPAVRGLQGKEESFACFLTKVTGIERDRSRVDHPYWRTGKIPTGGRQYSSVYTEKSALEQVKKQLDRTETPFSADLFYPHRFTPYIGAFVFGLATAEDRMKFLLKLCRSRTTAFHHPGNVTTYDSVREARVKPLKPVARPAVDGGILKFVPRLKNLRMCPMLLRQVGVEPLLVGVTEEQLGALVNYSLKMSKKSDDERELEGLNIWLRLAREAVERAAEKGE